jgi:hypothetical protein
MHLNKAPQEAPRKPCIRDLHQLTTTLLPADLVKLIPLKQLKRRVQEINATHPHFQEETPLVLTWETQRRKRLRGLLTVTARHRHQVA